MGERQAGPVLLTEAQSRFIQGGVSINVAGCDAQGRPTVTRALGCRVSADRLRVSLLLCPARCPQLLDALAARGAIAAVFSQPSTHQTLQLKGTDASVGPIAPEDPARLRSYAQAFVRDLCAIGYSTPFAQAVIGSQTEDLLAVSFTPTAAFEQSPGPNAGRRLAAPGS